MKIALLEKSFEQVQPEAIAFSASFYETLFQETPELKSLFEKIDQKAQEKKLIFSLAAIIENLRNPEVLGPALKSLGARHLQAGTLKAHYPLVGQALLKTLAQYLDKDWTPELSAAWTEAYETIAKIMLEGTENPEQHLEPELTFYDWVDLYGESNPTVHRAIASLTDFHYSNRSAS